MVASFRVSYSSGEAFLPPRRLCSFGLWCTSYRPPSSRPQVAAEHDVVGLVAGRLHHESAVVGVHHVAQVLVQLFRGNVPFSNLEVHVVVAPLDAGILASFHQLGTDAHPPVPVRYREVGKVRPNTGCVRKPQGVQTGVGVGCFLWQREGGRSMGGVAKEYRRRMREVWQLAGGALPFSWMV